MIAGTDYLGKDVLAAVQPAERRGAMSGEDEILQLWDHVYGGQRGTLATFSGSRPTVGDTKLEEVRSGFFHYPDEGPEASDWLRREALAGREVYFCAHLLTAPRRTKDNAALLAAFYADGDGASIGAGTPTPTAVVESSSRRTQLYWALTEPVVPEFGEHLNHRLALAIDSDRSGWDLSQLLRPPGTPNFKYLDAPLVRLLEITQERYDPAHLDQLLPPLPRQVSGTPRSRRPRDLGPTPDLARLSERMQGLIRNGNRGEYPSRSEADLAVCVAMVRAGFTEAEVWAVMAEPVNAISAKYLEKGRHGERYLELTIGKAQGIVASTARLGRRIYGRRRGVVSLG